MHNEHPDIQQVFEAPNISFHEAHREHLFEADAKDVYPQLSLAAEARSLI